MTSIVVLAGPTASGKSELALALAERLGGEIVNADSQQVYRGLDVGTAKPGAAERERVPHHLLAVVEPGEGMDAARWVALADAAIAGIATRGRVPIVVGGTGLYLRALLHGVAPAPGRDPALRAQLEDEARRAGRAALHARLRSVDPEAASRIGENDLVRIVRALEIAAAGRTQSEVFARHAFAENRYRARLLALAVDRAELHARIGRRLPGLFAGLLRESELLLARHGGTLPARLPLGSVEAAEVVAGARDEASAREQVAIAHRQYARRQVIWLRREPGVEWLRPPLDVAALADALRRWLSVGDGDPSVL